MAVTLQAPEMDPDTRRLMDAVVRDLVAAQRTGISTSRDFGPDVQPGGGITAPVGKPTMSDEESQRFFGNILQTLVTDVIPTVAPHILNLLQQRRRELGIPEQRDAAALERDFGSILSALLPKLLDAVPTLVSTIAGQPAPRSAEEETQRFLPFLAAVVPALISAAPAIIGAFNQQRGADPTPPAISDPDVAQRFFGPLLSAIVPPLLQSAPTILNTIFGGRRDIGGSRDVQSRTW
jgi:hypothetical protein